MKAATLILVLLATPALATVPLPACDWDAAAQRVVPGGQTEEPIFANMAGQDFVTWQVGWGQRSADVPTTAVVQHCPTGQYLLVAMPADNAMAAAATVRFNEMMDSDTGYTLRQVGEAVAQFGAGARIGQGDLGDCVCQEFGMK